MDITIPAVDYEVPIRRPEYTPRLGPHMNTTQEPRHVDQLGEGNLKKHLKGSVP